MPDHNTVFDLPRSHPAGDSNRILVVTAHPDDELLGPGGTLRRYALQGDEVYVVCLCENMSLRYGSPEQAGFDTADHLRQVAKKLGFRGVRVLGFPDQRLDASPLIDVIRPIECAVEQIQPRFVFTHWGGDLNRDHQVAHQATLVACRYKATSVDRLLAFETPSATEVAMPYNFSPNFFVDISATLADKVSALDCYSSEIQSYPGPRSARGLEERARTWGQACGMAAAEPFQILRSYWR